jgi:hypothetical protein
MCGKYWVATFLVCLLCITPSGYSFLLNMCVRTCCWSHRSLACPHPPILASNLGLVAVCMPGVPPKNKNVLVGYVLAHLGPPPAYTILGKLLYWLQIGADFRVATASISMLRVLMSGRLDVIAYVQLVYRSSSSSSDCLLADILPSSLGIS